MPSFDLTVHANTGAGGTVAAGLGVGGRAVAARFVGVGDGSGVSVAAGVGEGWGVSVSAGRGVKVGLGVRLGVGVGGLTIAMKVPASQAISTRAATAKPTNPISRLLFKCIFLHEDRPYYTPLSANGQSLDAENVKLEQSLSHLVESYCQWMNNCAMQVQVIFQIPGRTG